MTTSSTALILQPSQLAMAISNPGALGTIDAYISTVNRLPMLAAEQETLLARRLRDEQDIAAARELVLSHLRLVVSVARQYLGYGLPHADLIQEGNVGLMKAVKRFDPERGVRLVSFAVHWIKAEIHEYIVRNWRMVKVAAAGSVPRKANYWLSWDGKRFARGKDIAIMASGRPELLAAVHALFAAS